MCGICGIAGPGEVDPDRVRAMADALRHRGPDGEGLLALDGGRTVLGHRRLRILDLSDAGAQPMRYRERFTIVYNGEVYNYLGLREELRAKGHRFRSDTDTEVLLAAYAEWGEACLDRLDGMFAFAIHDVEDGSLFCARDRFGEKPLFYAEREGGLAFASEMKALFAGGVPAAVDRRMLFHYLAYDAVADANEPAATFFAGVRRLEPAHSLRRAADGRIVLRRYWRIDPGRREDSLSFEDARDRFRELFDTSVRRRLRSDVPLGSSLSGGIDSSSVVLTIPRLEPGGAPRRTFSARFDDPVLDEGRWMEMVAERAGAEASYTHPTAETVAGVLDDVVLHQEEPFPSTSVIAQWEVMRLAREGGVTVLLDGQGADEVLGGYLHYFRPLFTELFLTDPARLAAERRAFERRYGDRFPIPLDRRFRWEARRPGLLRLLGDLRRRLGRPAYLADLHPDFARAHRTAPPPFRTHRSLRDALLHSTTRQGLPTLLRFADRSSMAFSREVRLPFLSHELVEFVFALPSAYKVGDGWTKRLLRAAMEDRLPAELTWRVDKLGFTPPHDRWVASAPVRERTEAAAEALEREGVLRARRPERSWAYLMAAELLRLPARAARGTPAGR